MLRAQSLGELEQMAAEKPRKALKTINQELDKARQNNEPGVRWRLHIAKSTAFESLNAHDSIPKCIWIGHRFFEIDSPKQSFEKGYALLGTAYSHLFITDSAIFYFEKALQQVEGKDLSMELVYLDKLSLIHDANGSSAKAVEYCIQGIRAAEKVNANEYAALFNNRMGDIYAKQGDFARALASFNTALAKYVDANNPKGEAQTKLNIGKCYLSEEDYARAEMQFEEAFEIYSGLDEPKGLANALQGLGELEFAQNETIKAIDYEKRALAIRYGNRLYNDLPLSYVSLAKYYLHVKRYDDALDATRDGLASTRKTGYNVQLLDLYKQFYLIYKDLNYKDSALAYHEKYTLLKEEIDRTNNNALVIRLQNTFETERRQAELAEIKKVNELLDEKLQTSQQINDQDKLLRILLSVIILILLIVAGLFFSRYRLKSIANKMISRKVRENELLLQELHHRVKNNLQFISSLLNLQAHKITDNDSKILLNESVQKVKAMSLVHNQLTFNSNISEDTTFHTFIENLTSSLVLSLGLDSDQLKLVYKWTKVQFDMDAYNAVGLVINEMITNSFKHCDADDLQIKIFFVEKEKYRLIRYTDNGPGLEENFFTEEKQMGITLMKLLVEDLGGTLKYLKPKEGEHGIRIHINLRKISRNGR